jgi:hypothetical protein
LPLIQAAENWQKRILDADYTAVDIDDYIASLPHLNAVEQQQLATLWKSHDKLFGGGLGTYHASLIRTDRRRKTLSRASLPCTPSVWRSDKKEIERLTSIGVLRKRHQSEWAAPTFVQPKKTGDVRVLTDFQQLNKYFKQRSFPLPKISDLLQKLQGFWYATAIDLSMGITTSHWTPTPSGYVRWYYRGTNTNIYGCPWV